MWYNNRCRCSPCNLIWWSMGDGLVWNKLCFGRGLIWHWEGYYTENNILDWEIWMRKCPFWGDLFWIRSGQTFVNLLHAAVFSTKLLHFPLLQLQTRHPKSRWSWCYLKDANNFRLSTTSLAENAESLKFVLFENTAICSAIA